jgi:hypothetical protein
MSEEIIPCRMVVTEGTGELSLAPVRPLIIRPGESAMFSVDPPQVVVYRVWFGRRWFVASRAYLSGMRGPNLKLRRK